MILLFMIIFRSIPWFGSPATHLLFLLHYAHRKHIILTCISVLEGPAGDDVLDQDGVTLHEHQLWHQVYGGPFQIPNLHVHCAKLDCSYTIFLSKYILISQT